MRCGPGAKRRRKSWLSGMRWIFNCSAKMRPQTHKRKTNLPVLSHLTPLRGGSVLLGSDQKQLSHRATDVRHQPYSTATERGAVRLTSPFAFGRGRCTMPENSFADQTQS